MNSKKDDFIEKFFALFHKVDIFNVKHKQDSPILVFMHVSSNIVVKFWLEIA